MRLSTSALLTNVKFVAGRRCGMGFLRRRSHLEKAGRPSTVLLQQRPPPPVMAGTLRLDQTRNERLPLRRRRRARHCDSSRNYDGTMASTARGDDGYGSRRGQQRLAMMTAAALATETAETSTRRRRRRRRRRPWQSTASGTRRRRNNHGTADDKNKNVVTGTHHSGIPFSAFITKSLIVRQSS